MAKGDKCWIVENGSRITSVEILSASGNLVLIKTQNGKALRLPKHRLYDSKEKAEETLKGYKSAQKQRTPYDYME